MKIKTLSFKIPQLILASTLFLSASAFAQKANKMAQIYVDSGSTKEYQERRYEGGELVPESYHIMKGNFFGGNLSDPGLDTTTFETLAEALKMELVNQKYYPAREFKDGDLLIVVHWGITEPPEDESEDFGEDSDPSDTELADDDDFASEEELVTQENWDENTAVSQRPINERILGFDKASDDNSLSIVERQKLMAQYYTERYFFILMAYDWQEKQKTGESKLLWSTRFSLDSTGTNFLDSFPALLRGARDLYGVDLKGMANIETNYGEGEVKMGEVEVIGSGDEVKDIE